MPGAACVDGWREEKDTEEGRIWWMHEGRNGEVAEWIYGVIEE